MFFTFFYPIFNVLYNVLILVLRVCFNEYDHLKITFEMFINIFSYNFKMYGEEIASVALPPQM